MLVYVDATERERRSRGANTGSPLRHCRMSDIAPSENICVWMLSLQMFGTGLSVFRIVARFDYSLFELFLYESKNNFDIPKTGNRTSTLFIPYLHQHSCSRHGIRRL